MVFSPDGTHLKDIVFSAKHMACTTWGGKNHDIIFVASGKDRSPDAKAEDEGGHMFRYRPGPDIRGDPKHEFDG
jgi:sugar lactone lactonase YvrE